MMLKTTSYIPLKDPSSPKHNEPAFIHYINTMRQQFQAQHPTIPYDNLPKFTFSMYNDLPPVQKKIWEAHAAVDETRYLKELATYVPPPGYDSKGLAIPTWPKFSFNFFSSEMRPKLQGTNPDLSFEAIGQIILDTWQTLSSDEKQHYTNLELQDKTRFNSEMEAYRPQHHSVNLEIKTTRSFKMHLHPIGENTSFFPPTITTSITTNNNVKNIISTSNSIKPTDSDNMIMTAPLPDLGLAHYNMFPTAAARTRTSDSPRHLKVAREVDMHSSSIPGVDNLQLYHVDNELRKTHVKLDIFEEVKGAAPHNIVIADGFNPGLLSVTCVAAFNSEDKENYTTSIENKGKCAIPFHHVTKASPSKPDIFIKAVSPAKVGIKYTPSVPNGVSPNTVVRAIRKEYHNIWNVNNFVGVDDNRASINNHVNIEIMYHQVETYFNDSQHQTSKDAGATSDLNVLRIVNEPTATAIAYRFDKKDNEKNVLLFDLGGATFDMSLLTIEEGIFDVTTTTGETHLGGDIFDNRLVDYFLQDFKQRFKNDMSGGQRSKIYPRKKFAYDSIPPQAATEPPLPSSDVAQNHMPNPYKNSKLCHERIQAVRAKSTLPMNVKIDIDYDQPNTLYPHGYPHFVRSRDRVREYITSLFTSEIAIYDGVMGTMIQNYSKRNRLEEEDFRGETFTDWKCNVNGNIDMLCITQPHVIRDIYMQYLEVGGSSLFGTNTFSSTRITMADYEMEDYVYELNYPGARSAREACDEVTSKNPSRPRFVVGALGPTNCTASISPSVDDPSTRNVTFDELVDTFFEQTVALVDGGVDILMVATIFDTLNAKAALYAIGEFLEWSEKLSELLLLDETPLSLGLETPGGAKKTQTFSSYVDTKPGVLLPVYDGGRAITRNSNLLRKFSLDGISPMPRGQPQLDVCFDIAVIENFREHWYPQNVSDAEHDQLHPGILGLQRCLHIQQLFSFFDSLSSLHAVWYIVSLHIAHSLSLFCPFNIYACTQILNAGGCWDTTYWCTRIPTLFLCLTPSPESLV
jgi:hypothetical protein